MVVTGIPPEVVGRLGVLVSSVTSLGADRHLLELPATAAPERILSSVVAQGATVVSLNPIRETLEDVFVERVSHAVGDRGLGPS